MSEANCYDVLNRLTNSATGISGTTPSSCTASGTSIIDKTIGYDADGNMTCVSSASSCGGTVARSVSYTSFNMAGSIVQGGATIGLTYDDEHARIVQTQGSTTTTYLNDPVSGAMSEAVTSGGTTVWRDYIAADGGIVALRTTAPATGTATNWGDTTNAIWGNASFKWYGTAISVLYFTTDHLGSTSVLTDPSHIVQERDSYDAWGRRRNSNGTDNTACSITSLTTRGFTGQEMMDSVCAINLNARVYDPTIARMMSADPTIPNPMNGQSYNRYSYVNNRPLSATDPTGYWTVAGVSGYGPITSAGAGKSSDGGFGGIGTAGEFAIYGAQQYGNGTFSGSLSWVPSNLNSQGASDVGKGIQDLIAQQLADAGFDAPAVTPDDSTSAGTESGANSRSDITPAVDLGPGPPNPVECDAAGNCTPDITVTGCCSTGGTKEGPAPEPGLGNGGEDIILGVLTLPFGGEGFWAGTAERELAPLILRNAVNGREFEQAVISALGATKNTASLSADGLGTSIPDLIDEFGNVTEIKSGINLSFTNQLQIQAQQAEGSFNLIVGPNTQYISGPLQNAVSASGGTIQVFNPATGAFTPW